MDRPPYFFETRPPSKGMNIRPLTAQFELDNLELGGLVAECQELDTFWQEHGDNLSALGMYYT